MLALPWPSPGNCQHATWLLQVQPLDQGQGPQQPSATHNVPALERTLMHRFGPRKVFSVRAELGTIHLAPLAFNVMTMSGAFLSSTQECVCTHACTHAHTHTHTHTHSPSLSHKRAWLVFLKGGPRVLYQPALLASVSGRGPWVNLTNLEPHWGPRAHRCDSHAVRQVQGKGPQV